MNFGSTTPLSARFRFASRQYEHMLIVAAAFLIVVLLISLLFYFLRLGWFTFLIGDALALVGAGYIYNLLEKCPLKMACPNCTKIISSDTPWRCSCGQDNRNTDQYPFFLKCEFCGVIPKGYRCHHKLEHGGLCEGILYFSEDEDATGVVFRMNSPANISRDQVRASTVKAKEEARDDKDHDIAMAAKEVTLAQLDKRLSEIRKAAQTEPKKSPEESLKEFFDERMGIEKAAQQQKELIAQNCKGKRNQRERDDAVVDEWVMHQKAKLIGEE